MKSSPREFGFHMPAEWEPHSATWLSWPSNSETFPGAYLPKVEASYCSMVEAIARGEMARILVQDAKTKARAEKMLEKCGASMGNVAFEDIPTIDVWIRDYGPTFLVNNSSKAKGAVKWIFNAWGNKWQDLLPDNAAGMAVGKRSGSRVFEPGIVLEGGSIDVNGAGGLLTSEQCLLNKNRNPRLSKNGIEEKLKENLAVDEIIWLKKGIQGDDTDGHIDDFARFVSKKGVICAFSKKDDEDGIALRENYRILDEDPEIEVEKLPMPSALHASDDGRTLPASYANFYISNKTVLVPSFGDPADKDAAALLQSFFPGRDIVQIRSNELVYGYGGIHCMTQQQPSAAGKPVSPAARL